jgi:hypothetical protein
MHDVSVITRSNSNTPRVEPIDELKRRCVVGARRFRTRLGHSRPYFAIVLRDSKPVMETLPSDFARRRSVINPVGSLVSEVKNSVWSRLGAEVEESNCGIYQEISCTEAVCELSHHLPRGLHLSGSEQEVWWRDT